MPVSPVNVPGTITHWLMKAEPDTRIEKGKDVKFSIDDFEQMGTTPWDGVRNHQAKGFMKDKMKIGHQILFYHSNTKVPGVCGLGEVTKEGYPDASAFDTTHPYYDPKSNPSSPTWFLVNVTFSSRLLHPVTLALLKHVATLPTPSAVHSLGIGPWFDDDDLSAIKTLPLITRGRLSVQPVPERGYGVIVRLGREGGWGEEVASGKKAKKGRAKKEDKEGEEEEVKIEGQKGEDGVASQAEEKAEKGGRKRKAVKKEEVKVEDGEGEVAPPAPTRRKSARLK